MGAPSLKGSAKWEVGESGSSVERADAPRKSDLGIEIAKESTGSGEAIAE